jgi:glycosyltransferase 2 family protein
MSRGIRTAIGILLSLALLWWALRDVSFAEVLHRIRTADLGLLGLSVLIALAGFPLRAFRWGILLLPLAPRLPFRPRLAATFIGFAVNNLLPARVGEFARAFTLTRLSGVPLGGAFATLVVERLLDGLVLVALLFFVLASPGFPVVGALAGVDLRWAATVVAIGMLGVAAALYLTVAAPRTASRIVRRLATGLPERTREPVIGALRSFAAGLAVLRNGRLFLVSLLLAVGQWLFLATSFLLAFRAFEIDDVPFAGAVFLQSLISLAVAIPSSPGFFGPFEAAARVGLGLWAVPVDRAISFAIGYHLAGFLPVTVIGVYYIWRLNISWSEVRHSEEAVEEEIEPEPPQSVVGRT